MGSFYAQAPIVSSTSGSSGRAAVGSKPTLTDRSRFAGLDDPAVVRRSIVSGSETRASIIFDIPQIHCASCVWLLEQLHRFDAGILSSRAELPRRSLRLSYDPRSTSLRKIVELLASLGYEPDLSMAQIGRLERTRTPLRLYAQLGVAFFSFANIMLFVLPDYFTGGEIGDRLLGTLFRYASLLLSIPVLLFSSADYFAGAAVSLRRRVITLDLPLAIGIAMLFGRSAWDVLTAAGPGYFDAFTGLVFFLLLGKLMQQKLYAHLSFDRDIRAYLPISCVRTTDAAGCATPLERLVIGDRVIVRIGEIVPADALVISGSGSIDYSFVTGESEPVTVQAPAHLLAGGRLVNGRCEIELIRTVNHSYLASLWSDPRMQRSSASAKRSLTDRIAAPLTLGVLGIAALTAIYWQMTNPDVMIHAVTSVLLVACPCALALAGPFVDGTAMSLFGRRGLFLRSPSVIERLAQIRQIVFDKTGTLTERSAAASFAGEPLSEIDKRLVAAMLRRSAHPHATSILRSLGDLPDVQPEQWDEVPGGGIFGMINARQIRIGSELFVGGKTTQPAATSGQGSVWISIDGKVRGQFLLSPALRSGLAEAVATLRGRYSIAVLTGDSASDDRAIGKLLGPTDRLRTGCSPYDKLDEIDRLELNGTPVLMIGDGLNDAGALARASVGIAVTEDQARFSPAADGMMPGSAIHDMPKFLSVAAATRMLVLGCYLLSLAYNVVGLALAVSGQLSPVVAAILMPASSISIVLSAVLGTRLIWYRHTGASA